MANAWTIDKLDPKTKKALVKDILSGLPDNKIATNYAISPKCVARYKADKLFQTIADVWAEQKQEVAEGYEEQLSAITVRLNKVLDAIDRELADTNGEYDLSDARRSYPYIKMLNDTAKTLQQNMLTLAKITGDMKESVEIVNRPALILAQVGQIIQSSEGKEDMLDRLRTIQR